MQALRFALRNLWRDLKSGELAVLLLALVVAVLSLTAVGFFTGRISQGVRAQAAEVLAADLRLEAPTPIPARYFDEARRHGLRSAVAREKRVVAHPTRRDKCLAEQRKHHVAAAKDERARAIECVEESNIRR